MLSVCVVVVVVVRVVACCHGRVVDLSRRLGQKRTSKSKGIGMLRFKKTNAVHITLHGFSGLLSPSLEKRTCPRSLIAN